MATKAKDKLTAEKSPAAAKAKGKTAEATPAAAKAKGKAKGKTASASASAAKKTKGKAAAKATVSQKAQARKTKTDAIAVEEAPKQAAKAVIPPELEFLVSSETSPATATETATTEAATTEVSATETADLVARSNGSVGNGANGNGMTFVAADCLNGDIWVPNAAIPALDQATYELQKAQAEGQRRAIEVASLNLKNINGLHQLEGHSLDVAISAKANETQEAQLAGAEIDYQRQLELNGEKSQHLQQAVAKHEAATRETGYTDELISLKDQNFELEIQQAQNVFAEKAARYRAQLTGQ